MGAVTNQEVRQKAKKAIMKRWSHSTETSSP